MSKFVCNFCTFKLKFIWLLPFRNFVGVFIHFIPSGFVLLFSHFPNQNAFVFSTLSTSPEKFPKALIVFMDCSAEATSAQNKLVLSANWLSLISVVSLRSLRWFRRFRFARFVSLFRVLEHAPKNKTKQKRWSRKSIEFRTYWSEVTI